MWLRIKDNSIKRVHFDFCEISALDNKAKRPGVKNRAWRHPSLIPSIFSKAMFALWSPPQPVILSHQLKVPGLEKSPINYPRIESKASKGNSRRFFHSIRRFFVSPQRHSLVRNINLELLTYEHLDTEDFHMWMWMCVCACVSVPISVSRGKKRRKILPISLSETFFDVIETHSKKHSFNSPFTSRVFTRGARDRALGYNSSGCSSSSSCCSCSWLTQMASIV